MRTSEGRAIDRGRERASTERVQAAGSEYPVKDHAALGDEWSVVLPETDDFFGGRPQGLSHLALIHAACTLHGDRTRHVRESQ